MEAPVNSSFFLWIKEWGGSRIKQDEKYLIKGPLTECFKN